MGYRVVPEFGSNVDPPPNASGGVDLRNSPFPGPTLIFFRTFLVCQTALKLGYRVVLEFGSKVNPLHNASGGGSKLEQKQKRR